MPGVNGAPIGLSFELVRELLLSAITIAVQGALESLLCAVVANGMSGKKYNPNDELIGQGIGNIITPLFGGIPATAAIARTAANVKSRGSLPLASVVHALFILASILVLPPPFIIHSHGFDGCSVASCRVEYELGKTFYTINQDRTDR